MIVIRSRHESYLYSLQLPFNRRDAYLKLPLLFPASFHRSPGGDRNPAPTLPASNDPLCGCATVTSRPHEGPVTTMGCIFGKFTAGVGLFPVVAPHITAASTSRPPAASALAAGHRHPLRAPPPLEPEPPRRPFFIPNSAADPPAWPTWLSDAAGDVLAGFSPRRANSFEMLEKVSASDTIPWGKNFASFELLTRNPILWRLIWVARLGRGHTAMCTRRGTRW